MQRYVLTDWGSPAFVPSPASKLAWELSMVIGFAFLSLIVFQLFCYASLSLENCFLKE